MSRIKPASWSTGHAHTTDAHGMKFGHYYVVEASFFPANPVSRYIAHSARGTCVDIVHEGLEGGNTVALNQLAFFRVVEEITTMKDKPSRVMPGELFGARHAETIADVKPKVVPDLRAVAGSQLTLGGLITALEQYQPGYMVAIDSGMVPVSLASYRGNCEQLAIVPNPPDPRSPVMVGPFLSSLRGAEGGHFSGYKGGIYDMGFGTPLWVANPGDASGAMVVGVELKDHPHGKTVVILTCKEGPTA